MPLLDPALVKKHLRIDWADDDAIIEVYQTAAEDIVMEYINRPVYAAGDSPVPDDPYAMELTPSITAAILLLIGEMYDNREPDRRYFGAMLPRAVRSLLAPWRVWRTVSEDAC